MKNIIYSLLFICLTLSCVNSSEEPTIDCSGLSVSVVAFEASGCQTSGSVTLEASGGSESYTFSGNGVDFVESAFFQNLSAGNLTFFVKDAEGCTSSVEFLLEGDNAISLSVDVDIDCATETGSIVVNAAGGSGSFTYSIDGNTAQSSNTFSSLSSGVYTIEATDEGDCVARQEVPINAIVSLSNDITPIISTNCAISGCHNGSVSPNLTSNSSILEQANRIKIRTADGSMPRGRTLSETQIIQIACWVDAGAKDN